MKIKISKKILAIILLVLTLFSTAQPIFATSGEWVGGQFASYIWTTDNKDTIYGVLLRRLINYNTGEQRTVFCAEHGVDFDTGTVYSGEYYTPVNSKIRKACKIAYLGWYKEHGDYVINGGTSTADKKQYVLTQQFIWETLGQSSATFIDSGIQAEYVSFKKDIENQIAQMEQRPSFDGTTITIQAGESKTLTDTNGVLSSYPSLDTTTNGIRVQHSSGSNSMIITVDENTNLENYTITDAEFKSWGMIKNGTQDENSMVYFEFSDGVQNQLYSMAYNDPVTMSLSLNIELYGKLELSKLNTNGDLVDGAIFNVTGVNDYNQDVTVTNGKITLEKLKKGTYYIKEKSSPEGYLLNTETYTVEVKPNQTSTQAIINTEPTGSITVTKTNTNGDKIEGAKFTITASEDIYNVAKTVKYYAKGDIVAKITTNSTGVATQTNLPLGKYTIEEIEVPTGYLLDTEKREVNLQYKDQNTNVIYGSITVENDEPTGEITITKTDSDTGNCDRTDGTSHHGDASIKGAVYTLYAKENITNVAGTITYFSKDDPIATFTFNEYGVASIKIINSSTSANISVSGNVLKGLPMGAYYAKETTVPNGYTQDEKIYDYTFSYKDSNTKIIEIKGTVTNTVQKAPFEIVKITSNNNTVAEVVEGAKFTAILTKYVDYYGSFDEALKHLDEFAEDEYSTFETDSTGHGTSGLLAYGEYTVNETYTPSSEIETVEQFYVTIDKDSKTPIKELIANDLPFEAYIKLQKQDKDTGKFVTYSNATFELYKLNEDTNKWEQVKCKVGNNFYTSWTTNDEGIAMTETKLEAGTYKVEEIKIPTGFIQLDEELTFEVNNRNSTLEYDEDYDAWITVTVQNDQPVGKLELTKIVNLREDVDTTLIEDIDYTQISFRLTTSEDIIDYADGSVKYESGTIIGEYSLNEDGTLTVEDLPMGSYILEEISTINGAVLDDTKYDVVFEQTDTTTKEYVINLNVENETTCIEISKTDITGENELIGATLTVTDENNEVIDSWTSTSETHKIEGLEVEKTYTLTEEIAPDGYVKATSITFTVENTEEIQKVTMVDKIVTITKEDIGGNEIEGAELKVVDKDGNIIDSWTSTKEAHIISGLTEGESYILYEDYAPDGYVISNSIEFTVTTDKETQEVVMIDKVVEIVKTDLVTGEEIEGAELEVIDKETGETIDKWTSTKEPHKVTGLEENKTYILRETTCPYGYELAEEIEFTVTEDKETQKIEMQDMPILTDIRVIKVDSETKEVIKDVFTFAIYADEECTELLQQVESNAEDGYVDFTDLRYGTYYIKELSSPDGYELSDKIVKVEINDTGIFIDGEQIEQDENEVYSFEFENVKIETPKTGDNRNMVLATIIAIVSLLGLVTMFIVKAKRKNK